MTKYDIDGTRIWETKDISWTALTLIIVACVVFLAWFLGRDTSSGEVQNYPPSACVYMDDAFNDGTLTPRQQDYYLRNC